ncbi:MAG: flavodoxin family protein [Candidatus Goldiibacteriota bacterium]|jgi:multimeric flavodoxin WrbA
MLIITASPRKNSNSTAAALYLAKLTGLKYEIVDINRLKIHPCIACDKCAPSGKCVYHDDGEMLIKKVKKADMILAASPVYFTGVPAPLKAFIDRNQAVWNSSYAKKTKNKKPGIIILTEGHKKSKYFIGAESEIRSLFAVNNIKTTAVIKIKSMDHEGAVLKNKRAMEKLQQAALLPGAL